MDTTKATTGAAYRVTLTVRNGESTESRHRDFPSAYRLASGAARKIAHPAAAAGFARELERERALTRPISLRLPGVAVLVVESTPVTAGDRVCPWNVHPSDIRCTLPRGHASSCAVVVRAAREPIPVDRGVIRPVFVDRHDFRPVVVEGAVVSGCSCGWDELTGREHRGVTA